MESRETAKVLRFPLPGEAKQRLEEREALETKAILKSLDNHSDISGFILDSLLWMFCSGILGQGIRLSSLVFSAIGVYRFLVVITTLAILGSLYLVWKDERLLKPLGYRWFLLVFGVILGIL